MNVFIVVIFSVLNLHLFAQVSEKKVYCGSKIRTTKRIVLSYSTKGLLKNHEPRIANRKTYTFPETKKAKTLKRRRPSKKNGCIAATF